MSEAAKYWRSIQDRRDTTKRSGFIRWRNYLRDQVGDTASKWRWDEQLLKRLLLT